MEWLISVMQDQFKPVEEFNATIRGLQSENFRDGVKVVDTKGLQNSFEYIQSEIAEVKSSHGQACLKLR